MSSAFTIRRTVFVWVLIPMTVASGFPQMHCRCGEAKGQQLGDCCLSKAADQSEKSLSCCCAHAATSKLTAQDKAGSCPTCHQVQARRAGGCCYWRDGAPRVLSKPIPVPELTAQIFDVAWTIRSLALPNVAQIAGGELGDDPLPPPDRVILFQHLLI